jgi:hypothetical protein
MSLDPDQIEILGWIRTHMKQLRIKKTATSNKDSPYRVGEGGIASR